MMNDRKESGPDPGVGEPAGEENEQSRPGYYYDDATGYEKYDPEADDGDVAGED